MKLDALLHPTSPLEIPQLVSEAERLGFQGLWFGETQHDALLASAMAAHHTERAEVGTAITMAFSRSPMALAYTCWDLQSLARGRFILGLGSQVKGHVERRFSVKWVPPVPKMREVLESLRAIWTTWQTGEPLKYEGQHFSFSLMTPFFNPGPLEHPDIPVYLAAVNTRMASLAGELCQGIHIHPLHTVRYVEEVLKPAVLKGAQKAGRSLSDVTFASSVLVATGRNHQEIETTREIMRQQVAFYASTKSYRPVLEIHGWGELGEKLYRLSITGRWNEMPSLVSREVLEEFVLEAPLDDLATAVKEKYHGVLGRVALYLAFQQEDWWAPFVASFSSLG